MRRLAVAVVVAAGLISPAAALAHAGDFTTQLQNATRACAARFSGCDYRRHDVNPSGHGRGFLFTRNNTSGNGQTCYQWYDVTHDGVVVSDVFLGCF